LILKEKTPSVCIVDRQKRCIKIIENPIIFDYQVNQSKIFFSKNENYNIFKKQIIKKIFKNPETDSNKLFIIIKKKLIKNNISKKKINETIYCLIKINF
jgi:predicted metal-binding transcription factor (methanogenesis marker protein 9)